MGGKMATVTHVAGGAANAALMLISAGLAAAYGLKGVRVNAVNPSTTLTARMQGITRDEALGRVAAPEEIANAVLFLCSPRASYISGAVLSIDGAISPIVV
jgi:NAD(P)-dependent dehydrogenase (short-subunit alcohol dehydrogenase family)